MGSAKETARWTEVIEKIMHDNRGVASLGLLYQQASLYRSPLPAGDWQKTLRGVLYRFEPVSASASLRCRERNSQQVYFSL